MKKSVLFTIGIVAVIIPVALLLMSSVEQPERRPVSSGSNERIVLTQSRSDKSLRPKAPSRQVVTCFYDGLYLCFDFVVPEGECNVTVTEWYSNAVQNYTIDSSELSADIYVGELYESTVTVTTANGNTYTAELTAE